MASADPVSHNSLILSTNLWKGDANSPGTVSAFVVGVAYDVTGFLKFPAARKESKHEASDSFAALELPSLVD